MRYYDKIKYIKEHAKDDLVTLQAGIFYLAVGKDAVFLNKLLGLKCTCFANGVCKVGFPIGSLDKYAEKLNETGYSYVIYETKSDCEFKLKRINITQKKFEESSCNIGCENCTKNKNDNGKVEINLKSLVIELERYRETNNEGK